MNPARALVLGGTGYVGRSVLAGLARAGVPTTFTYFRSEERARTLATELSQQPHCLDVTEVGSMRQFFAQTVAAWKPNVFVHCVGLGQPLTIEEIGDADWERIHAVNLRSAFVACRALAPLMAAEGGGSIVLTAALDSVKPVPSPVHFAATQGGLAAMTRALGKELGPRGVRVNLVVLGVLDGGLSTALDRKLREDYKRFSAMGRMGTADEAAEAILWVALHDTYMTGGILTVDGGL